MPHPTDPILTVAGRGGIGLTATNIQVAVGHTHTEIAGAHHYTGVAGQTRVHTGQGISMLGGAIAANNGMGLELIAGNGDILMQAQSDTLTVASQKDMTISAGQPIDFAAAKKIVIKTAAGATIEIGSAGINVTAPGSFTVHAASHQFVSGGGVEYALPELPTSDPTKHSLRWKVVSAVDGRPANAQDAISMSRSKEIIQSAQTGGDGRSSREFAPAWPEDRAVLLGSGEWVVDVDSELDPIAIERDEGDEDEDDAGFTGSESA